MRLPDRERKTGRRNLGAPERHEEIQRKQGGRHVTPRGTVCMSPHCHLDLFPVGQR